MNIKSTVVALASVLVCGAAHAEPVPPAPVEYGFEDELVPGDLLRPQGEIVQVRRRNGRASLIELRSSYLPELLKSVEDL